MTLGLTRDVSMSLDADARPVDAFVRVAQGDLGAGLHAACDRS
jgi:hypothetical protein